MRFNEAKRQQIIEKIEAARTAGTTLSKAIRAAGISEQTYRNWTKRKARKATQKNTAPKADVPAGQVYVMYGSAVIVGTPELMSQFVKTLH